MSIRLMRFRIAIAVMFGAFLKIAVGLAQERNLVIALIGDSTVTEKSGWGGAFAARVGDSAKVINFAVNGRSSKSWYDEHRLPTVASVKPDYVLIQFGHNDQPGKGMQHESDPASSYRDNLKKYVNEFRKIGAKPILISPVTRRTFDEKGKIESTLLPWAQAAQTVAQEMKVPFIDLHALSMAYHNAVGPEASMDFNRKKGDLTHFSPKGAQVIADLILEELKNNTRVFKVHVRKPAEL